MEERMIYYLQCKLNVVKRLEDQGKTKDFVYDDALSEMIACKEMVEFLIGEPVNCRLDGKVTIGY